MIYLREFFQTGQIADLHLGVCRLAVRRSLGSPDDFLNPQLAPNDHVWDETNAPFWWYGGIEFTFDAKACDEPEQQPLQSIQFKSYYLYLRRWPTSVQRWVFRSRHGPTRQRLAAALTRAGFPYQDTGLETLKFNPQTEKFTPVAYQPLDLSDAHVESFGTLVLQNGIQIRYAEDDSLIQVQLGSAWLFQGRECFIQW